MTWLDDRPDPPMAAHSAAPLTPQEIDAHPDANRIWATIIEIREEHETLIDEVKMRPAICDICGDAV